MIKGINVVKITSTPLQSKNSINCNRKNDIKISKENNMEKKIKMRQQIVCINLRNIHKLSQYEQHLQEDYY